MARQATAIGNRILRCAEACDARDWEQALLSLFPAIDRTAKSRRQKAKVGDRFRAFIADEEDIISVAATGNLITRNVFAGLTFEQVIYDFARNSLVHEGELDPRLKFDDSVGLTFGKIWNLPTSYVPALALAVVAARENKGKWCNSRIGLSFCGRALVIDESWGCEDRLREEIRTIFGPYLRLDE